MFCHVFLPRDLFLLYLPARVIFRLSSSQGVQENNHEPVPGTTGRVRPALHVLPALRGPRLRSRHHEPLRHSVLQDVPDREVSVTDVCFWRLAARVYGENVNRLAVFTQPNRQIFALTDFPLKGLITSNLQFLFTRTASCLTDKDWVFRPKVRN